jgi:hypothetical protein
MKRLTLCLLLALAAGSTLAQTKLAPGLWEHGTKINTASGEMGAAMARMQEQLAAMPPERRKQMEEAMARQGISMSGTPGQGMAINVCITPEKAARDELPMHEGQCKQTSRSRSGNTLKFAFECGGTRKASGEGEVTFASDKAYTGRLKVTSQRGTKEETMEMETNARWLGADCGAVKPRP